MPSTSDLFDAVIIGGGPAGLSAALTLGRAQRRVLVAHDGPPRNAPAHAAQGVFTRDGTPPAELLRIGREQLAPYGVEVRDVRVDAVTPEAQPAEASGEDNRSGFAVTLASGETVHTRTVVLATGVRDVLPEVPGFRELWGTGVFHCPFCHGWEVRNEPLAIYANGARAVHLAMLIPGWSDDLILFTDGPATFSDEERESIERRGIAIREEPLARLAIRDEHLQAVVLKNGESVQRAAMFAAVEPELRSNLAVHLGCDLTEMGQVQTDPFGRTSVAGVYAAGDTSPAFQQVIAAAASGSAAGAGIVLDLLAREFA